MTKPTTADCTRALDEITAADLSERSEIEMDLAAAIAKYRRAKTVTERSRALAEIKDARDRAFEWGRNRG